MKGIVLILIASLLFVVMFNYGEPVIWWLSALGCLGTTICWIITYSLHYQKRIYQIQYVVLRVSIGTLAVLFMIYLLL